MSASTLVVRFGASIAALSLVSAADQFQPESAAVAESGIRFSSMRLSTGVALQVAEAGPSDGEPVLFLHGYTDSWFSYSPALERLPAGIRAIAPTQRGHGDSEKPECCYRPADFAADAVALLDELRIERATVVGHSYGSFVAQRLAIDHPERVNGLVLIGSGTTGATPAVVEFNEVVQALSDPLDPAFVREFQASTAAEPLPPEFFEGVVGQDLRRAARAARARVPRPARPALARRDPATPATDDLSFARHALGG